MKNHKGSHRPFQINGWHIFILYAFHSTFASAHQIPCYTDDNVFEWNAAVLLSEMYYVIFDSLATEVAVVLVDGSHIHNEYRRYFCAHLEFIRVFLFRMLWLQLKTVVNHLFPFTFYSQNMFSNSAHRKDFRNKNHNFHAPFFPLLIRKYSKIDVKRVELSDLKTLISNFYQYTRIITAIVQL